MLRFIFCPKTYNLLSGDKGKDSCQGDSGGPLIVEEDGAYTLGISHLYNFDAFFIIIFLLLLSPSAKKKQVKIVDVV